LGVSKVFTILSTKFNRVKWALFYIEKDAEILPACHTWKLAEKGFKMAFVMYKLAIINSYEIIIEK
jgi:hypothetical protein